MISKVEAQQRLHDLADAMPQLVWIAQPEGGVLFFNSRMESYSGMTKSGDVWLWQEMVHEDDLQQAYDAWLRSAAQLSAYSAQVRLKMKDGSYRWHLSHALPQFDNQGNVKAWIGSATDIHEQKLIEDRLRFSSALTNSIADAVIGTVRGSEGDYTIVSWNKGAEMVYGYAAHEVLGRLAKEILKTTFIRPDDTEAWKQSLEAKGHWQGEVIQETIDGRKINVLASIAQVYDEGGRIIGTVAVNRDISSQTLVAEELRLAKEQLEQTFRNIPSAIYLFRVDGKILYANDLAASWMGYDSVAQLLDEQTIDNFKAQLSSRFILRREDGQPHNIESNTVARALETGQASEVVLEMINRKTGETRWILSKSAIIPGPDGKVSQILTTTTDITIQKKSEYSIRESEKKFRILIEAFPHMAWVADATGRGIYFNQRYLEYTGLTMDEAVNQQPATCIHPEDWKNAADFYLSCIQTGTPVELELRYKRAIDQQYYWFLVRAVPIKNEQGEIAQWVGTSTDIQHLKDNSDLLEQQVRDRTRELSLLNKKLQEQTLSLKQSNDDLQQFAHVTSHDLKEPVRKIKMYSNLLGSNYEQLLSDKGRNYLKKIESATTRISAMIDGVLQYSMAQGTVPQYAKVDLNTLVRDIWDDLEVIVSAKQARIAVDALPELFGVPTLLYQLFYNLINNSLKFSKPNVSPQIMIRVADTSPKHINGFSFSTMHYWCITVEDNGIGFEQVYAEKIFESFQRLNSKDQYEGTGLGLALCKKIVERHDGLILAEGNPGKGAKFTVCLPRLSKDAG